jgi:cytidine deaminase
MEDSIRNELIRIASDMRGMAYAPYSNYYVGAAILTDSGRVYSGCNVENASYGATVCAERTAALKAVSEGDRQFSALAVAVSGDSGYPCGICRQFLSEFITEDIEVILINKDDAVTIDSFNRIFPSGFSSKDMD